MHDPDSSGIFLAFLSRRSRYQARGAMGRSLVTDNFCDLQAKESSSRSPLGQERLCTAIYCIFRCPMRRPGMQNRAFTSLLADLAHRTDISLAHNRGHFSDTATIGKCATNKSSALHSQSHQSRCTSIPLVTLRPGFEAEHGCNRDPARLFADQIAAIDHVEIEVVDRPPLR